MAAVVIEMNKEDGVTTTTPIKNSSIPSISTSIMKYISSIRKTIHLINKNNSNRNLAVTSAVSAVP